MREESHLARLALLDLHTTLLLLLVVVAVVVEALAALDAQLARGDLLLDNAHRLEERLVLE